MYFKICVVIMIIISLLYWSCKKNKFFVENISIYMVICIVSTFLLCVFGFGIYSFNRHSYWDQYSIKTNLYTLNDCIDNNNYNISGAYLLIGGYVSGNNEPDKYNITYAYKDNNGIVRPKHKEFDFDSDKFGYLEDGEAYYEEIHTTRYFVQNDFCIWLFGGTSEPEISSIKGDDTVSDNVFHVPKGTVVKSINVDLK